MSKLDENLKEYAKDLFLQFDPETGKKKYSFRELAELIQQKFNKVVHSSTISLWAKNGQWDILFQDILNQGMENEINSEREKEQAIKDVKAQEVSKIYKHNKAKNDMTAYIVIEYLKYYAEKLQSGEMSVEQVMDSLPIRDLEYINRLSLENMERMSGGKEEDKLDRLFTAISSLV